MSSLSQLHWILNSQEIQYLMILGDSQTTLSLLKFCVLTSLAKAVSNAVHNTMNILGSILQKYPLCKTY